MKESENAAWNQYKADVTMTLWHDTQVTLKLLTMTDWVVSLFLYIINFMSIYNAWPFATPSAHLAKPSAV